MNIRGNRRSAMRGKDGRVQRKNKHRPTVSYGYFVDRESPGRGFRHVVTKRDVQTFIERIPDWPEVSRKIERIVLVREAESDGEYAFYHHEETSGIFLNAWPKDLWMDFTVDYFDAHRKILERLGVAHDARNGELVAVRFTEAQARAFMLLHVFLHELGNHQQRLAGQK